MYEIIGEIAGFTLNTYLFYLFLLLGILLLLLMLFGCCVAWKRMCCPHCLFAFITTFYTVFFIGVGIAMAVVAILAANQLEDMCSSGGSSEIQKAFSEIYSRSDTFYCVSGSSGCECRVTHTVTSSTRTYNTVTTGGIIKVQECSAQLQAAYASYGVSFDDINSIITYLNYFGQIEEGYTCSGMCTQLPVYYFWDSTQGEPPKKCIDPITDEILRGEILGLGIGYAIVGLVIFVIWFVQYGLCCRKKQPPGGTKRF